MSCLRSFFHLSILLALTFGLAACAGAFEKTPAPVAGSTRVPAAQAAPMPNSVVNAIGDSNVEQADAQLQKSGSQFDLIFVSTKSTGVQADIYRDLRQRNIRATTGPDEGIDTQGESCYPNCVFIPREEADAISVEAWIEVLRHEYRHIIQEKNNPDMARDFRNSQGLFTTYAAFSEACADYGIDVEPLYHAQERIDRLKQVLGAVRQGLLDRACDGDKLAYQTLLDQYNQSAGYSGAFGDLFPPYE